MQWENSSNYLFVGRSQPNSDHKSMARNAVVGHQIGRIFENKNSKEFKFLFIGKFSKEIF